MSTRIPKRLGGAPAGGAIGQVLTKLSGSDFDFAWMEEGSIASTTPPGTIMDFATFILPVGYLAANGDIYPTAAYAGLFSTMGNLHSINVYISDVPSSMFKYNFPLKPWLSAIDTGGQVVSVPVRLNVYNGVHPGTMDGDTDYWIRYTTYPLTADPMFTLHPTQADAIANTNKVSVASGSFVGSSADRWVATIEKAGYFRVPNYMYNGGLFRRTYSDTGTAKLGSYFKDTLASHSHTYAKWEGYTGVGTESIGNYDGNGGGRNRSVASTGVNGSSETAPRHVSVLVGIKT